MPMRPSIRKKLGFQPPVVNGKSPEEEAAIERQKKKERWAKEKEQKEKERRRKERKWDHANSSGGVYTQMYKKDNGDISWWRMCFM